MLYKLYSENICYKSVQRFRVTCLFTGQYMKLCQHEPKLSFHTNPYFMIEMGQLLEIHYFEVKKKFWQNIFCSTKKINNWNVFCSCVFSQPIFTLPF